MLEKIKKTLLTTCVSYTLVMLFNFAFGVSKLTSSIVYQIFIVCCLVNLVIFITSQLPIKDVIKDIICVLDIIIIVLLANIYIFNTKIDLQNIIEISVFSTIIYFMVYALVFAKNKADATTINDKLKERKQNK